MTTLMAVRPSLLASAVPAVGMICWPKDREKQPLRLQIFGEMTLCWQGSLFILADFQLAASFDAQHVSAALQQQNVDQCKLYADLTFKIIVSEPFLGPLGLELEMPQHSYQLLLLLQKSPPPGSIALRYRLVNVYRKVAGSACPLLVSVTHDGDGRQDPKH